MIICQELHQVLRMNTISSLSSSDSESHKGRQVQSHVIRMHAQSLSRVWLFCNPMDRSPPGTSVLINFQARILEQVAISYSRGSFWLRDQTHVSCAGCWDTIPRVHVYAVWSIWWNSQSYVEVITEIQLVSWCKARGKSGMKRAKAFQRGRMAQTQAKRGKITWYMRKWFHLGHRLLRLGEK